MADRCNCGGGGGQYPHGYRVYNERDLPRGARVTPECGRSRGYEDRPQPRYQDHDDRPPYRGGGCSDGSCSSRGGSWGD